jgi:putative ABC transport system substrate-binding protein
LGEKQMRERIWMSFPNFRSDNRKSKTCPESYRRSDNLKSVGFFALVIVFVGLAGGVESQQPAKVPRIGYLQGVSPSPMAARTDAFREGLRDLGYVEGKDIVIEWRSAEGKFDRLTALASELVRLKVDVIVSAGPTVTRPVKDATSTIPIVMAQDIDPVGNGFVASLARPGGNITGLATLSPEMSGKLLEILKEIIPRLLRLAVIANSTNPGDAQAKKETELAAEAFKVQLQYLDVRDPKDIEPAFRAANKARADALLVLGNPILNAHRKQVVDLAVKNRLAATYSRPELINAGGLMYYGTNYNDLYRRAATYVDKILKGAKPADLPVEQPTKFELVINLKAAKQIGLTISPNLLARADRVLR